MRLPSSSYLAFEIHPSDCVYQYCLFRFIAEAIVNVQFG